MPMAATSRATPAAARGTTRRERVGLEPVELHPRHRAQQVKERVAAGLEAGSFTAGSASTMASAPERSASMAMSASRGSTAEETSTTGVGFVAMICQAA